MPNLKTTAALLGSALTFALLAGCSPSTAAPALDDTAAILQCGRDRSQAMVDGDVDLLSALLTDDFTAVHINGYEQPKAEWLEQIAAGDMAYHNVEEVSASVEFAGTDTATLIARNLVTATINGANGTWPLESTTTYARQNGVWLATSSRSSTY